MPLLFMAAALSLAVHSQQPIRPFDRLIALDLRAATIADALATIADSAHITIDYNRTDVSAVAQRVTYLGSHVTVRTALEHVLANRFVAHEAGIDQVIVTRADTVVAVSGIVSDSASGQPIAFVNVLLKGSKVGTVTGDDGVFRLRVPNADTVLLFFRIGYQRREVRVPAGTTALNVRLGQTPQSISAVQVTASAHQQPVEHTPDIAVVQEIKMAPSVVSGIASEQIARMADINVAQIVRHIAAVTVRDESFLVVRGMNERYNATYLDDNLAPSTELYSRAFDLSLLPDRIVDKILVYKSPRADLIGDMTGAAVKIYTKDALAIRRFDLSVRVGDRAMSTGKDMLSYSGGSTDWLGIDNGTRALPSAVPPFGSLRLATLSQSQYIASFSPILSDRIVSAPPDLQLTASYYDNWRLGGSVNLYNVTSGSYTNETRATGVYTQQGQTQIPIPGSLTFQAVNNYAEHDQQATTKANLNLLENLTLRFGSANQLYFKNFLLQQGTALTADQIRNPSDTIGPPGSGVAGIWSRNIVLSWEQRFVYQGNLGGVHDVASNQSIAWNLGLTSALHSIPDQRVTRFQNNNQYLPHQPSSDSAIGAFNENWKAIDPSCCASGGSYAQTGTISRVWTRNDEQIYNGSLDYTISPAGWIDLKAGTYDYQKDRTVDRRVYSVFDGEYVLTSGQVGSGYPGITRYVNPNLVNFRSQDLSHVWSTTYFPNDMTGLAVTDNTGPTDAYRATETYDAGYVMVTLKPFGGRVDLDAGWRAEYDQIRLAAAERGSGLQGTGNSEAIPLLVHRQTTSSLPSVNLAIRPWSSLVFRAAWGKTVNRPEFREISPFEDFDYVNNAVITGNPALVQANIDNTDVRLEFYPGQGSDMLSIGGYYKDLHNAIERIDYTETALNQGFLFSETIGYDNVPHAIVKGLETEVRKGLFWDLSLIGSGALIASRARGAVQSTVFLSTGGARTLQGQPPYIIDGGLAYDNPRIGLRVSSTYTESGTSIYAVGATKAEPPGATSSPRGSIFELPRGLLEGAITYSVGSAWRIKLSGQNLLNEANRFAQDENFDAKYQPEHYDPKTKAYVGDNIFRRYNPGQYFLFTVVRSF